MEFYNDFSFYLLNVFIYYLFIIRFYSYTIMPSIAIKTDPVRFAFNKSHFSSYCNLLPR